MTWRRALAGCCGVVTALSLGACAPAPTDEDAQAAGEAVAQLRASYVEHYNMGHADVVAELFTEDAVAVFADGARADGRPAIQRALEAELAGSPRLGVTSEEMQVLGDWAVDRGQFSVEVAPEGEAVTQSGNYIVVCRRGADGTWRVHWLVANAAAAAPAAS